MKLKKILLNNNLLILLAIIILLTIYYLLFNPLIDNNIGERIIKKNKELITMQKIASTINTNKVSKSSVLTIITSVKNSNKLTNAFTKTQIKNNIINIKINNANYVFLANFIVELSNYQIFVDNIKINKESSGLVSGSIKLINSSL